MKLSRFIKLPAAIFGVAIILFILVQLVLMFWGIKLDSGGNLNNTRMLFGACLILSVPIAIKYLK